MKLKRIVFLTITLIFTSNLFSQTIKENENSIVKIELNKSEYTQSDTVKLFITNLSQDTFSIANIRFSSECIKLIKKKEKEWEELHINYFSGGVRHGARSQFLPGEVILFDWDQRHYTGDYGSHPRKSVSKGIYKFEFHFLKNKYPDSSKDYVSYSKEFEIK